MNCGLAKSTKRMCVDTLSWNDDQIEFARTQRMCQTQCTHINAFIDYSKSISAVSECSSDSLWLCMCVCLHPHTFRCQCLYFVCKLYFQYLSIRFGFNRNILLHNSILMCVFNVHQTKCNEISWNRIKCEKQCDSVNE